MSGIIVAPSGFVPLPAVPRPQLPGRGVLSVGPDPPPAPQVGDLWWRTHPDGAFYLWYDDGSSAQWVTASPAAATPSPSAPRWITFPNPPLTVGQTYTATNGLTYTWDGQVWSANPPVVVVPPPTSTPAVHGLWIGTQVGSAITLTGTPQQLASVQTSVANLVDPTVVEDPLRWSVIVAQVTVTIGFGAPGSAPVADVSLELHRGDQDTLGGDTTVHTRELFWNATTMGTVNALGIDVPVTLLLMGQPGLGAGDVSNAWSVWGSASLSGGAVAYSSSAQVYTMQFS